MTFANSVVTFDGTNKSIAVSGNLPTGVSMAYEYNGAAFSGIKNAGVYKIVAKFTHNNAKYNAISDMVAVLEITPEVVSETGSCSSNIGDSLLPILLILAAMAIFVVILRKRNRKNY